MSKKGEWPEIWVSIFPENRRAAIRARWSQLRADLADPYRKRSTAIKGEEDAE